MSTNDVSEQLKAVIHLPPSKRWTPAYHKHLQFVIRAHGMEGYNVELAQEFGGKGLTVHMYSAPQPIEMFHWFRRTPPNPSELEIMYQAVGMPWNTHRSHKDAAIMAIKGPLNVTPLRCWLRVACVEARQGSYDVARSICHRLVCECGIPSIANAVSGYISVYHLQLTTPVEVAEAVVMLALIDAMASASVLSLPIRNLQIALQLNWKVWPFVHHFRLVLMVRHRKELLESMLANVVWPYAGVDVMLKSQQMAAAMIRREQRLVHHVFDRDHFLKLTDKAMHMRLAAPDLQGRNHGLTYMWERLVQIVKAGYGNEALAAAMAARAADEEAGIRTRVCGWCGKEATRMRRCSGCLWAHYCCAEHQKVDWKVHKYECQKQQ
jgi:hypothetical protein